MRAHSGMCAGISPQEQAVDEERLQLLHTFWCSYVLQRTNYDDIPGRECVYQWESDDEHMRFFDRYAVQHFQEKVHLY